MSTIAKSHGKGLAKFYRKIFLSAFPKQTSLCRLMRFVPSQNQAVRGIAEIKLPRQLERFSVSLDLSDGTRVGLAFAFSDEWGWLVCAFHEDWGLDRHWGAKQNDQLTSDLLIGLGNSSALAGEVYQIIDTCFPTVGDHGGYGLGSIFDGSDSFSFGKRNAASLMERIEDVFPREERVILNL